MEEYVYQLWAFNSCLKQSYDPKTSKSTNSLFAWNTYCTCMYHNILNVGCLIMYMYIQHIISFEVGGGETVMKGPGAEIDSPYIP
jgi:hypothetical protein